MVSYIPITIEEGETKMSALQAPKALTLRLNPKLHAEISELARRREVSVNALIQQNLETLVRVEEEKARYDAYSLLGQEPEECDVEYTIPAQAEVMLRDES
jgi:hypothetical protein